MKKAKAIKSETGDGSSVTADASTGSLAPAASEKLLERALGAQIRLLRRQHDLSVSDLARASDLSNGMLSKIENGAISASLSSLQAIATALQVPLSSLFASFEERQDCSYVKAGSGVTIDRRGTKVGHVYELLGHALRGEIVVEPYLIRLKKDAVAYTGFRHSGIEFIHMIEGELEYRHGSETYHLEPGDSLLFDSSALHGPEHLHGGEIRYLSIIIYPRI
jgi:transcriptional regulator with XRE-family HTH domain